MREDARAELRQSLIFAHQVQVVIRLDLKQVQYLVEHLSVLGGDAYPRLHAGFGGKLTDDRGKFDRFGAGAENSKDSHGSFLV
ncbi:MAG: hypothetical protein KPEEDBHJ_03404 [Anaerolineales bacterium]|nr:hypothetical protein [Anaerolineales bacterium]